MDITTTHSRVNIITKGRDKVHTELSDLCLASIIGNVSCKYIII